MKGILGRKVGMTSVFTKDGKLIPVTVVEVLPNKVMQVKTIEKDGYNAIQLGAIDKKANRANKAEIGSAKKANTTPKRFLKEIRDYEGSYNIGDEITADLFTVGEIVDVEGKLLRLQVKKARLASSTSKEYSFRDDVFFNTNLYEFDVDLLKLQGICTVFCTFLLVIYIIFIIYLYYNIISTNLIRTKKREPFWTLYNLVEL